MAANPTSAAASWFNMALSHPSSKTHGAGDAPKRHAACDECRQRKLKCSGEPTGCSRCVRQSLFCHYSIQKQMGRPPKRKRVDESKQSVSIQTPDEGAITDLLPIFEGIPDPVAALEASNMCPAIYKSFMKDQYDLKAGPFVTNGPIFEYEALPPEQISEWKPQDPDYSQINTSVLLQSPEYHAIDTSFPAPSTHTTNQCSCLSYLYLCLSSISTLSSFPLSVHSLTTLYNAARTAKSVIHCQICPKAFNTSMQNLMLLGTLLNVTADGWFLVSGKDPELLGKECVDLSYIASLPTDPELRQQHWKSWLRGVVKHAVIGSSVPPIVHAAQTQCLETPSLLSLIEDLEERQRKRHEALAADAMAAGGQPQSGHGDEQDYFCMRVVGSARLVIARFNFDEE
ncbi:predicted protein [Uncinocarpus reesii 1704]|uniref:Zn(2)-C6 fungal-type domain-containing protein n=1 Tax=Uncinocarpus reesii (strain UAMH 1704) TaxID=336963 RepID=C4JTG5_UNCRE|nr:uncharacterized protein UREG_05754 [Uncinocarpus reesii 1704]EEP80912.1 predicted protein [Uncinocarpus reesii 1704]